MISSHPLVSVSPNSQVCCLTFPQTDFYFEGQSLSWNDSSSDWTSVSHVNAAFKSNWDSQFILDVEAEGLFLLCESCGQKSREAGSGYGSRGGENTRLLIDDGCVFSACRSHWGRTGCVCWYVTYRLSTHSSSFRCDWVWEARKRSGIQVWLRTEAAGRAGSTVLRGSQISFEMFHCCFNPFTENEIMFHWKILRLTVASFSAFLKRLLSRGPMRVLETTTGKNPTTTKFFHLLEFLLCNLKMKLNWFLVKTHLVTKTVDQEAK